MGTLREKIETFRKGVEAYTANKPVKDPEVAHTIARLTPNLDKIEVVFEFECYLDGDKLKEEIAGESKPKKVKNVVRADLSKYTGGWQGQSDRTWRSFVEDCLSQYAKRLVNIYYADEMIKKENYPNKRYYERKAREELPNGTPEELDQKARELFHTDAVEDINLWGFVHRIRYELKMNLESALVNSGAIEHLNPGYFYRNGKIYRRSDVQTSTMRSRSENSRGSLLETQYKQLSSLIHTTFNAPVKYHVKYHNIPTQFKIDHPDHWFVESDGSLRGGEPSTEYFLVEVTSAHVGGTQAQRLLEDFKTKIWDRLNGRTNDRSGLHVNIFTHGIVVDVPKLVMLLDEKGYLKDFGREESRYAKPHQERLNRARTPEKNISLDDVKKKIESSLSRDKMMTVRIDEYDFNTGKGRLEFRIMGGDYLGSLYAKTVKTLQKFLYLIAAASDPHAYKEQYAVKLSRFKKKVEPTVEITPLRQLTLAKQVNEKIGEYLALDEVHQTDPQKYKGILTMIKEAYPAIVSRPQLKEKVLDTLKVINHYFWVHDILDSDNYHFGYVFRMPDADLDKVYKAVWDCYRDSDNTTEHNLGLFNKVIAALGRIYNHDIELPLKVVKTLLAGKRFNNINIKAIILHTSFMQGTEPLVKEVFEYLAEHMPSLENPHA